MPYIKPENRPPLDRIVDLMLATDMKPDGDLNYILFKYARRIPHSYATLKSYRAELRETADEIGRRMLAPYEDAAKERNGDVL